MPRAKTAPRRDVLKQELADALGVNAADILTRPEVVSQFGEELGYTNEKSLSNSSAVAPCFYLAPLFGPLRAAKGIGLALYSRRDLWLWLHDLNARREMEKLGKNGRPYPWPTVAPSIPQPPRPTKSDAEVGLGNITDDKDYMDMVLGRRPWT